MTAGRCLVGAARSGLDISAFFSSAISNTVKVIPNAVRDPDKL
jgi:hypothetical protein